MSTPQSTPHNHSVSSTTDNAENRQSCSLLSFLLHCTRLQKPLPRTQDRVSMGDCYVGVMQAKAKGRGRKRSTPLIIDDADAVQIRGTVGLHSLPSMCNPVTADHMPVAVSQLRSSTLHGCAMQGGFGRKLLHDLCYTCHISSHPESWRC